MKITEDIDLADFKAWDGGKDTLDTLIENGKCEEAQGYIEELFPDGISDTDLNDWLWFEAEDQFPGWFFDYSEMEEVENKVNDMNKVGPMGRPIFMEADGGDVYYLETDRENDDDPTETPKLKLQAASYVVTNAGSTCNGVVEIEYDFSESFEDNVQRLKDEMAQDNILPVLLEDMEYVEDFPEWAICEAMYNEGTDLTDEEKRQVNDWMLENGYGELVDALEPTRTNFDKYPAFGLACATETVVMRKIDSPVWRIEKRRKSDDDFVEYYNEENTFDSHWYSKEEAIKHLPGNTDDSPFYYEATCVYSPRKNEKESK